MSAPTKAQRRHVDHEMAQAIRISRALADPSSLQWDRDLVVRALRVAYAAHFRALMEFFHDGRPPKKGPRKKQKRRDLVASQFLPASEGPAKWTRREKARFSAVDKLVGHLSKDRTRRHHANREWGDADDEKMLLRHIRRLFRMQPRAWGWFPDTAALLCQHQGSSESVGPTSSSPRPGPA